MHDDVMLSGIFIFLCGLLLGNCGYQTDRKKDLLGTCQKSAGREGGGNRGRVTTF